MNLRRIQADFILQCSEGTMKAKVFDLRNTNRYVNTKNIFFVWILIFCLRKFLLSYCKIVYGVVRHIYSRLKLLYSFRL